MARVKQKKVSLAFRASFLGRCSSTVIFQVCWESFDMETFAVR